MRRAYSQVLRTLLDGAPLMRRGFGWLAQAASAHVRPGLTPPFAPPILATLEVTRACNLRCRSCAFHRGGAATPDAEWMAAIIREIAGAGVIGLGITGGEPLLWEGLEEAGALAARLGLVTHLNTNGTMVTEERGLRLLEAGWHSINVSLDGASEEVHERMRGPHSFRAALEGAQRLVHSRKRLGVPTRLRFAMRLCEENAGDAEALLGLASETGMDACTFLPVVEFDRSGARTASPAAVEAAAALAAARDDPRVDNSRAYLRGMARFFLGAPMPSRCSALRTSLVVSADRTIFPCVPSAAQAGAGLPLTEPAGLLERYRTGGLHAPAARERCRACWWNCHRELDIALGVI